MGTSGDRRKTQGAGDVTHTRFVAVAVLTVFAMFGLFAGAAPQALSESERVAAWREQRLAELTADDGWLTLVALAWMHDGRNQAGGAKGMDLHLPGNAPDFLGTFDWHRDGVTFTAAPKVVVTVGGVPFPRGPLAFDKTLLEVGSLRMLAIKRGERVGLRVRDVASPRRKAFAGVDLFPVDARWSVAARLETVTPPRAVPIINVLGDASDYQSPGRLVFSLDGVSYSLDALLEDADARDLFVIFKDRTNGTATYPAGRYLHVPMPVDGKTVIDFNEAYNPPCAFTTFATCPLPPRQNWLKIPIEAGERAYHHADR